MVYTGIPGMSTKLDFKLDCNSETHNNFLRRNTLTVTLSQKSHSVSKKFFKPLIVSLRKLIFPTQPTQVVRIRVYIQLNLWRYLK